MNGKIRVLIVEDNPDDAELIARELRRGGFDPEWALATMARHRVRVTFLTPTAIRMMRPFAVPAELKLRDIISGGEPMAPDLPQWCREKFGIAQPVGPNALKTSLRLLAERDVGRLIALDEIFQVLYQVGRWFERCRAVSKNDTMADDPVVTEHIG